MGEFTSNNAKDGLSSLLGQYPCFHIKLYAFILGSNCIKAETLEL